MSDLQIPLPPEMEPFRSDLTFFMQMMVRKLHINRHKGFIEGKSLEYLLNGFRNEGNELTEALKSESQFSAALEAVDAANQAFLVAAKVWQMDKKEYGEYQNPPSMAVLTPVHDPRKIGGEDYRPPRPPPNSIERRFKEPES